MGQFLSMIAWIFGAREPRNYYRRGRRVPFNRHPVPVLFAEINELNEVGPRVLRRNNPFDDDDPNEQPEIRLRPKRGRRG